MALKRSGYSMPPTTNGLDRMWEKLDKVTDLLLDEDLDEGATLLATGGARGISECLAEFYGGNMTYVRDTAMKRRALRERDQEPA